jgi:hypothetical protein
MCNSLENVTVILHQTTFSTLLFTSKSFAFILFIGNFWLLFKLGFVLDFIVKLWSWINETSGYLHVRIVFNCCLKPSYQRRDWLWRIMTWTNSCYLASHRSSFWRSFVFKWSCVLISCLVFSETIRFLNQLIVTVIWNLGNLLFQILRIWLNWLIEGIVCLIWWILGMNISLKLVRLIHLYL